MLTHWKPALIAIVTAVMATACSAPKNVTYFQGVDTLTPEQLNLQQSNVNAILVPGDMLNIRVYGSDPAALAPFNKGQVATPEGQVTNLNNNYSSTQENSTDYYLINQEGDIQFPMLGEIHAAGLTKQQLTDLIADKISPKYVKEKPVVEIRLMNFKVSILGEVKSPGQYRSANERLNILEALALAGDLDIKGQRDNVLLYRTNPDGTREVHRLNLNDENILLSPYFNLQQNDFIYVEPNRAGKQGAWTMGNGWTASLSVVGGLSSVAALVVAIVSLTKK